MSVKQVEHVSAEPIRKLLRTVSNDRADELDALFDEVAPACELDRDSEDNLFQAESGSPNIIRVGLKCTVRLQAHAYAEGIIIAALGTPGFAEMDREEQHELLSPADDFLNWTVGLDLQRWLKNQGVDLKPEQILQGASSDLPAGLLGSLNERQRILGEGLFRYASAFILLHELAHLKFGHKEKTIENEKVADRFAAEWMSESAFESSGDVEADRLIALHGIAVALLWVTVRNVYFGQRKSTSHPEGYERLSQVLDNVIDWGDEQECEVVWGFVSTMLFIHMGSAGFDFDETDAAHMQSDPRENVNHLIDRISKWDRKR